MSIEVSLAPYPGRVFFCENQDETAKRFHAVTGNTYEKSSKHAGLTTADNDKANVVVYFVWADDLPTLAHEINHVCLFVFDHIDADPRGCNGEPFCYLSQHLMREAMKLKRFRNGSV